MTAIEAQPIWIEDEDGERTLNPQWLKVDTYSQPVPAGEFTMLITHLSTGHVVQGSGRGSQFRMRQNLLAELTEKVARKAPE